MIETQLRIPEQYQKFQKAEYSIYAKAVEYDLTKEYRLPYHFSFGDTYGIKTNSGEDMHVVSIFRQPGKPNPLTPFDQVYLFAFNQENQLVGHLFSWVHFDKTYTKVLDEIALYERGKGYAIPLELVHQHILQERANQTQKRIVYEARNGNDKKLQLKRQDPHIPDVLLGELEKEQARWQDMYSPNGKLGINEHGVKHFYPEPISFDTQTIKRREIQLQRRDIIDSGRALATTEIIDWQEIGDEIDGEDKIHTLVTLLKNAA